MLDKVIVAITATDGMLRPGTAADVILFTLTAEQQAAPMEINIQPESHLFF